MQNSDFWIRITSLYGSQPSSFFFCIHNRDISTRFASLYECQPSSLVFAFKTATLAPEFQVSIGPSPHLCFLHAKQLLLNQNYKSLWVPASICFFCCIHNSDISTRIASLYGSQPSSLVFAFKTATLAPELQVSIGPSPHLCFLHAKQRLLNQNYKSLWVPDHSCRFVHAKQRD